MEALLHKSQIMEDHVDINAGMGLLEGRQSGRKLGVGSSVRARIVSLLQIQATHAAQRLV